MMVNFGRLKAFPNSSNHPGSLFLKYASSTAKPLSLTVFWSWEPKDNPNHRDYDASTTVAFDVKNGSHR